MATITIKKDIPITIYSYKNGKAATFETKIEKAISNSSFLIAPIRQNISNQTMLLNFTSVNNDIHANINGRLVVFQNVKITNVIENGKTYHKITIFNNGTIKERRRTSRYLINKHCIASLGAHRKAVGATLRDVSSTGFSIITDEEIKDYDNTRVTFHTGANSRNSSAYLNGVVVRKEPYANGRYLYGCKIITNSSNYSTFLDKYKKAN